MRGHEQAVHVEDGQHVQQHVVFAPAPIFVQHLRVGGQIAVRQHRALAAAGGAGRVQDGGQVFRLALHGLERLRQAARSVQQRARAVFVQRVDVRAAGLVGGALHPVLVLAGADHDGRLGIAQEVLDLGFAIGRVQRQVHQAGAQGGQVQQQRFRRLFYLHRHARPVGQVQRRQQVGQARGGAVDVIPGVFKVGRFQRDFAAVFGKAALQDSIEIGVAHLGQSPEKDGSTPARNARTPSWWSRLSA
ncbi:hypothetical protein D3C73_850010 [compost metagenome]